MSIFESVLPPSADDPSVNIATSERIATAVAGIGATALALQKRNASTPFLLAAGGMLLYRAFSGECALYRKFGVHTGRAHEAGVRGNRGFRVEQKIEVTRAPAQVYGYWRNLENLPNFMPHVKSVEQRGLGIYHWMVEGPAGTRIEWDAEIINEHPGQLLAWQTLGGSDVEHAGTVRFTPINNGQGTIVSVVMQYEPPMGGVGATVARLFREAPEQQLSADLLRFKELIEADSDAMAT